jgi:FkbM family methyltransferase
MSQWVDAFRARARASRSPESRAAEPAAVRTATQLEELHRTGVYPDYEAALESAYTMFLAPGMTVLDVGAHLGRHTARFGALVGPRGQVIAFEPLPQMAQSLRDELGTLSNIEIRELALGAHTGPLEFVHVENSPGESGLREREVYNIGEPVRSTILVDASTIDEQCAELQRLDFVKIDIEGGEIDCLRAGAATIARYRPIVSVEYGAEAYAGYGHTRETLLAHCEASDYLISDLFGNIVNSKEDWLLVCDRGSWDYFLVPRERIEEWNSLPWVGP